MRSAARLRPLLLLTGALLLLASLYLPWRAPPCGLVASYFSGSTESVATLPNLFAGCVPGVNGWSSEVGSASALFSLLLAAVAAAACLRPNLVRGLPLGLLALLAGYFGLALGAATNSGSQGLAQVAKTEGYHLRYCSGAYLGVAGTILVLVTAAASQKELARFRAPSRLARLVLAVGLLAVLLLPWSRFLGTSQTVFLGIAAPAGPVVAVLAICLAAARKQPPWLAAAVVLFTGGVVSSLSLGQQRTWECWLGLGLAVALLALDLRGGISRPARYAPVTGAAAALLVIGLFLPAQKECVGGQCISSNGWTTDAGTAAAMLAVAIVLVALAARRGPVIELAAGLGIMVATLGFAARAPSLSMGYGLVIDCAAAAVLVALAVVHVRQPRLDVRLVPVAICLAYLVIVVVPWWDVLSRRAEVSLRFAPVGWLTIAGVLVAIRLLGLWVRQGELDHRVVSLPLGLLALAALELIRFRDSGLAWGGGIVVGLSVALVALGYYGRRGWGFQVPEILRVDRL
jgi:hypothetical protein